MEEGTNEVDLEEETEVGDHHSEVDEVETEVGDHHLVEEDHEEVLVQDEEETEKCFLRYVNLAARLVKYHSDQQEKNQCTVLIVSERTMEEIAEVETEEDEMVDETLVLDQLHDLTEKTDQLHDLMILEKL